MRKHLKKLICLTTVLVMTGAGTILSNAFDSSDIVNVSQELLGGGVQSKAVTGGAANIADFVIEDGVLKEYTGSDEEVIIPEGVTSINDSAFRYNQNKKNIKKIVIPDSVTEIGGAAFLGCGIESIEIPDTVAKIEGIAFWDCVNLQSVKLPNRESLDIGYNVFTNCDNLETLEIPEKARWFVGVESIGVNRSIKNINVAQGNPYYKSIDGCLYQMKDGTDKLILLVCPPAKEAMTIPADMVGRRANALMYADALSTITVEVGNDIYQMYDGCLYHTLDNKLTLVWCPKSAGKITIDPQTDYIEQYAAYGCSLVETVEIPANVKVIGEGAFGNCKALKEISFPEGLKEIGQEALSACYYLTEIEIPDTVTSLGGRAFAACNNVTKLKLSLGLNKIDYLYVARGITELVIPPQVTEIQGLSHGSWGTDEPLKIKIPESVEKFSGYFELDKTEIIYGVPGSAAETFANENGLTFKNISLWKEEGLEDPFDGVEIVPGEATPIDRPSDIYDVISDDDPDDDYDNPDDDDNDPDDDYDNPDDDYDDPDDDYGNSDGNYDDSDDDYDDSDNSYDSSDRTESKWHKDSVSQNSVEIIESGEWVKDETGWWLRRTNGTYPVNQWAVKGGVTYWFDGTGYMAEGWRMIDGSWYYFYPEQGNMASGWIFVQGVWYYLKADGKMQTGWILDNGKWYYLNADGAMKTGWLKDADKWYYLSQSGAMLANTVTPDGYKVDESGVWLEK